MAETYTSIEKLHQSLPPFTPYLSAGLLPYLAFITLVATFALGFYFTTYVGNIRAWLPIHTMSRLPKATIPIHEVGVASLASVLAGFGVVALFCSVGVNV
ncbi:hypothetical protein K439DRAFT_1410502 [Ramaria rubella]|nr:hypothetical protein K439DRAFT_1410502 [Ramaria rubella]